MAETPTGWALLHSQLPKAAIKPIPEAVYNVKGLSDVNEGYLIQRLFAAGLDWEWRLHPHNYLGFEDRESQAGKSYRVYMFSVQGVLTIAGRDFHGAGASDNRKLDAAIKGSTTVAFKNACKMAGLTIELFKDGKAMDFLYSDERLNKAASVEEIVEWAEGASNSDQRQGSGEASDKRGATSVERPDGAVNSAPPQPVSETGELDLQVLFDLGRSLPKDPLTALEVQAMVAAKGYGGARTRLLLDHGRQCGKAPCEHVAVKAGLK